MLSKSDINTFQKLFVTKEEFMSRSDALMYELKAIREEMTIFGWRQAELYDQLEAVDKKVVHLTLKTQPKGD